MMTTQQKCSEDVVSELSTLAPVVSTQTKRMLSLQTLEYIQMNKKGLMR